MRAGASASLRGVVLAGVAAAACLLPALAAAQEDPPRRRFLPSRSGAVGPDGELRDFEEINVPYDGRFTFVRLMFDPTGGPMDFIRRDLKWDHDYPRAERNFARILDEVSTVGPYLGGGNVLAMDDPELFKYPVAYLSEPGYWRMTDGEAASLREWLQKGGFLIVDDFVGDQWFGFRRAMEQLLPDHRLVQLDASHPIFDSFFHIESLDYDHPNFRVKAVFYGVFENDDPEDRLMVIVNYNNDIGDYWEWSDTGFVPIELSNEAYKLGVNYIIYAMTH